MSDIKTSCSCHSDQNLLKYIWSRLVRKRSDCICNRLAIQMDNNDQEPRPEERPSLDTSTEEEEDEEDVKICVDMAALNVTRPHTQVDYYHHLVPFLSEITNSSFYWGKMDRVFTRRQARGKFSVTRFSPGRVSVQRQLPTIWSESPRQDRGTES